MVYGSNYLQLTHEESGVVLRFDACGALAGWVEERLPPLQLLRAKQWKASRLQEIEQSRAHVLEYDWTYTTSYRGTVRGGDGRDLDGALAATAQRIDRTMLMARDPIAFADAVPLYESEMDDNGVSACSVRVRVMPKCWFVLLRFWLRVDDMVVRVRDVRYFCKFEWGPCFIREVKHSEGTFAELGVPEGPQGNAKFSDGDAAAQLLDAQAPVGLRLLSNEALSLPGHSVPDS